MNKRDDINDYRKTNSPNKKRRRLGKPGRELGHAPLLLVAAVLLSAAASAQNNPISLQVVDDAGQPVNDYRWQLQEDISNPGIPYVQTNNTVSIVGHRSDARILAYGHATSSIWPIRVPKYAWPDVVPPGTIVPAASVPSGGTPYVMLTNNTPYNNASYDQDPSPTNKYFIQVLASGYAMGGVQIPAGVNGTFKLVVNRDPLPTTQISVLVFNDHLPLNNEPDSEEEGLPGFRILMFDFNGGPLNQDAFSNPVGTTYETVTNADGTWNFVPDPVTKYKIKKLGDGFIYTDKDGKALIQNMWNSIYSIMAIPPTGENWVGGHAAVANVNAMKSGGFQWQDNTIEGTPFIDAWGQANGSRVFIEGWGSGFYHVFFGFVDPDKLPGCGPAPGSTIQGVTVKGRLVVNHYGRPPQTAIIAAGQPIKDAWVGLNIANAALEGAPPVEGVDMAKLPANTCVWAGACDPETGEFTIPNVAPGYYTLASWDRPLDMIFNSRDLVVPTNGSPNVINGVYNIGDVLQVRWFGTMQGKVFYDANGNGFPDPGEEVLPKVPVQLRFRDGSLYQQTSTFVDGTYQFQEVFPFFKWLIAEVDNSRWRPSGVTAVVDDGGTLPAAAAFENTDVVDPTLVVRNPQPQYAVNADGTVNTNAPIINPSTGNNLSRTQTTTNDTQPVFTQAFQNYNGQNSRLDFGKQVWGPGTNGGISGIVIYKTMRAEDDPRFAFQDPYDPCVARAQIALYQFETNYYYLATNHAAQMAAAGTPVPTVDGLPADINLWKIKIQRPGATYPRLADVDNYPFGWSTGGTRGPEDVDRDDPTHQLSDVGRVFNPGDAIQIVHSSSWDDTVNANLNPAFPGAGGWPPGTLSPNPPIIGGRPIIGSDNFATWEQIRPGMYDGMYTINSYHPGGIASGSAELMYLPVGDYIVQCSPPPGQLIMTEESQNDWTGDTYQPGKLDLPPELTGDFHLVPQYESLFGMNANPPQYIPANYANQWRPLADRKLATVTDGRNFVCNFHVYSEVPKAAHVVGFVLQDLSAEFDPNNPIYGERDGAAWIPVSIRDWQSHEIAHSYSDEFGCYDLMVVSSYTASMPSPASFADNITTVILNDPTMPADPRDPNGPRVPDPYWNPAIGIAPVPLDYWPGRVNYADTPVIPIGAFQGGPNGQLDVEPPTRTPVIQAVAGTLVGTNAGPYIGSLGDAVTLTSAGLTQVLDPTYKIKGVPARLSTIRDYGFGAGGTVTLTPTDRSSPPVNAHISSWNTTNIVFTVGNAPGTTTPTGGKEWQVMVTRADSGQTSQIGITLSYEPNPARVHMVVPPPPAAPVALLQPAAPPNTNIQAAVDAALPGDLVIVPVYAPAWNEYIVMYKPIRLQGSGAGTIINGQPDPQNRVPAWHNKITSLLGGDDPFVINECPGVEVFGETTQGKVVPPSANPGDYMVLTGFGTIPSRIDGFLFKGCIHGGGINVYNEGSNLRISNNRIKGNMGDSFNGGISIGAPAGGGIEGGVFGEDPGAQTTYNNTNVIIEYNQVLMNSSLDGGGGISVNTGATYYKIRNNWIMGNFCFDSPGAAMALYGAGNGGGGILHSGLCPGGIIAENVIAYNEVYFGYSTGGGDGGGILIQGESDGTSPTGTSGTGNVTIIGNLIMGNLAGAGYGGGIALIGVNGPEILDTNNIPVFEGNAPGTFPDDFVGLPSADPAQWYQVDIFNNVIVNNAAGWSAGGIGLQDSVKVRIIGNTIANNDSCTVALNAFPPNLGVSTPQGAGIVSRPNSQYLPADLPTIAPQYGSGFSNPTLENNIIWHNRSYHFDYSLTGRAYNDPNNHMPIDTSGGLVLDGYVDLYVVGGGSMNPQNCILSSSGTAPNFVAPFQNTNVTGLVYDEGGNNSISLRFWPISLYQNSSYSLAAGTSSGGAVQGDYHLAAALPGGANLNAITEPGFPTEFPLAHDYDDNPRPATPDIGAVQFAAGATPFLPGVMDANLAMYPGGLIPNPNNNAYAPTPPPVAGEPPHLAEGEPVAEANPLIPPKGYQPPTALNPVWMTAPPTGRLFDGYVTFGDVQNWYNFTSRLQSHDPYTDLGTLAPALPAVANDPVGQYIFNNLSGTWPDAPLADGEEPPAPMFNTKQMLALWNDGWVKYTQPAYYAPSDQTMFGLILADLNTIIQGNNIYTNVAPGGVPLSGYTPSARTLFLATNVPPGSQTINMTLLNRSVIQDAFLEVRRWYDPNVAYYQLVCGDGFAEMADKTELYIFGFSDQTAVANNPTDDPNKGPDKILLYAKSDGTTAAPAATLSAPTMIVKQNQEFHLNLANAGFYFRPDLFDPHTVHFHGYPNASAIFDGMPLASVAVHEGGNLPYFYNVPIEGTYFYHCHVEATEHMQMGMIGNLWVEPAQDDLPDGTSLKGFIHHTGYKYAYNDGDGSTYFDVEYPIQVTGLDHYFHNQDFSILPVQFSTLFDDYPLLNGRGYPDTVNTGFLTNSMGQAGQQVNSLITARKGQKILIRYSNVSETEFVTLTVPDIPMTIIAKDGRLLRGMSINPGDSGNFVANGPSTFTRTTSYTIGGGESVDFILDTTNTQPGTYFLYGARLQELSNDQEDYGGLMTHIVITP